LAGWCLTAQTGYIVPQEYGKYHVEPGDKTDTSHHKTMKRHTKPRKSWTFFSLGFVETVPSPQLGFLRRVFLVNDLASIDNLTRTTNKQNT